jgi:hypothetical protein
MDPTIDAMLIIYAAALRRHQQHLEDGCDRRAWHVLARHLIERAVWSANSTDDVVGDGGRCLGTRTCSTRTITKARPDRSSCVIIWDAASRLGRVPIDEPRAAPPRSRLHPHDSR